MFNNVALDVVIGLVFIFLLYSLLASIIQEIIATKLAFRSKILEKAILRMLEDGKTTSSHPLLDSLKGFYKLIFRSNNLKDKRFATAFYTHPLLKYLAENTWFSKPDYISAKNFSKTMIDLLHGIDTDMRGTNILKIKESIDSGKLNINLGKTDLDNPANKNYVEQNQTQTDEVDINPDTRLFLRSLLNESKGDIEKFKLLLENWFDDTMQRATGWYKRYIQYILVIIGFTLACIFNVDSIAIGKILSKDEKARDQIVQMATTSTEKYKSIVDSRRPGDSTGSQIDTLLQSTYQLIMDDANKATQVMGLGKPWKDSCKICNDSLKSKTYVSDLTEANKSMADLAIQKNESLRLGVQLESDSSIKNVNKDSIRKVKSVLDKSIDSASQFLPEWQRLSRLDARCTFIKKARKGKWFKYSPNQEGGLETFAGWLITALAISLGAPFWFDLLSKLVKIRGSGKIKEASEGGAATAASTPGTQTININTNSGEEAVG